MKTTSKGIKIGQQTYVGLEKGIVIGEDCGRFIVALNEGGTTLTDYIRLEPVREADKLPTPLRLISIPGQPVGFVSTTPQPSPSRPVGFVNEAKYPIVMPGSKEGYQKTVMARSSDETPTGWKDPRSDRLKGIKDIRQAVSRPYGLKYNNQGPVGSHKSSKNEAAYGIAGDPTMTGRSIPQARSSDEQSPFTNIKSTGPGRVYGNMGTPGMGSTPRAAPVGRKDKSGWKSPAPPSYQKPEKALPTFMRDALAGKHSDKDWRPSDEPSSRVQRRQRNRKVAAQFGAIDWGDNDRDDVKKRLDALGKRLPGKSMPVIDPKHYTKKTNEALVQQKLGAGGRLRASLATAPMSGKLGVAPMSGTLKGGITHGQVIRQPTSPKDSLTKVDDTKKAEKAAQPSQIHPQSFGEHVGLKVKVGGLSGVVIGEADWRKHRVAMDDGSIELVENFLPAVGAVQWVPQQSTYEAPAISLGDLVRHDGNEGVIVEADPKASKVVFDDGQKATILNTELTLVEVGERRFHVGVPKHVKASVLRKDKEAAKHDGKIDDVAKKLKAKKNEGVEEGKDEAFEKAKASLIEAQYRNKQAVRESVVGMAPCAPSMGLTSPSQAHQIPVDMSAEGATIIVDGQEAQILGFTNFDQNMMPTEARISINGEEKIIPFGSAAALTQAPMPQIQRSTPLPQPTITAESTAFNPGNRPKAPSFMKHLVEGVREGRGGTGGSFGPSSQTMDLEAQLNAHLTGGN